MQGKEPSVHLDAVKHQVRLRLDQLRKMQYLQLASLPEVEGETIDFGPSRYRLTTFREGLQGEQIAIIVRCGPEGATQRFWWQGLYAEGFYITPEGTISDLPDRMRYAYM